jgi:hypothetical protein
MIKVGDKVVNLVKNQAINTDIGDILEVVYVDDDCDLPYGLRNCTKYMGITWWYARTSFRKFCVPISEVSDKDLFTAKLTGEFPGVEYYNFSDADNAAFFPYFDPTQLPPYTYLDWKIEYYYGDMGLIAN